jgi:hypothetical protein
VRDRSRAQQRLDKFLLRHDLVYRAGSAWTARYELWLGGLRFDDAALRATFAHYRGVVSARDAELAAVEAALTAWTERGLSLSEAGGSQGSVRASGQILGRCAGRCSRQPTSSTSFPRT